MAEGKDEQGFQLWWIAAVLAVVAAIVVGILLADGGDDGVDTVSDEDSTPADTVGTVAPDEPSGDEPVSDDEPGEGEGDSPNEPPTMDTLANTTYQSEFTESGEAPLVDGEYREPATEGSATETVVLLGDPVATGTLNDEAAAAVILITDPGGSGTFYNLAIVVERDGESVNIATTYLGDRVEVNALNIVDNQILVGLVEADASEESLRIYELQGDELVPA